MSAPSTATSSEAQPTKPLQRFVDARWKVLAICFFVTGFLGIPLIFMCKQMSVTEKWIWSIVVTIYTFALIFGAAAICYWSYTVIRSSLA